MRDKAIEYKGLAHKIEVMLNNIESLNINVSNYRKIFEKIIEEVENSSKTSSKREDGYESMFLTQDYTTGITKLKKLEIELEKLDIYFKALKFSEYLNIQIKKEISTENLKEFVNQLIEFIKGIKYSNTLYYQEEKKVVEKIYETTYEIIKLELITFGKSELYNYCKEEESDLFFLDLCVKRDLERLNLEDEKYSKIKERKLYLESNGIGTSYFDLEMIKLIISLEYEEELKQKITKRLEQIINEINLNIDDIDSKYNQYEDNTSKHNCLKIGINRLKKHTLLLILTASIYITVLFLTHKMAKTLSTTDYYEKKIETFSEYGHEQRTDLESVNSLATDKLYLKEYSGWEQISHNFYGRNVRIYDISHMNLKSVEEYLNIDTKLLNIDYIEETEKKYNDDIWPFNTTDYLELEKIDINEDIIIEKQSKEGFWIILLIAYVLELTIILLWEVMQDGFGYANVLYNLERIKNEFFEIGNYQENLKVLRKECNELLELIKKDELLRNKFIELYEENKFLLDNKEELLKRIYELENKEELVKTLKRKI